VVASRSDRGNLVNRAKRLGYDYVSDPADLGDANGPKLLGLFANEEMFQQAPEGAPASLTSTWSLWAPTSSTTASLRSSTTRRPPTGREK
jgi:alkaline phosphatase